MPLLHKSRREILDAIRSLPSLADLVATEDGRFKYELDLEVVVYGRNYQGKKVGPYVRLLTFDPGETVIREGAWGGNTFYVVVKGQPEVFLKNVGSGNVKVAEIPPGRHFGEMSVLAGVPRSATIKAPDDQPVQVLEIQRPALRLLRKLSTFSESLDSVYFHYGRKSTFQELDIAPALSQRLISETIGWSQFRVFSKNHVLFQEGAAIDHIYIVKEGWLRRSKKGANEPELNGSYDFKGSGYCFGLEALDGDAVWPYTATLLGRSEVLLIPIAEIRQNTTLIDDMRSELARFTPSAIGSGFAKEPAIDEKTLSAQEKLINTGLVDGTNLLVMDMNLCVRCGRCSMACHKIHGQSRLLRRGIHIAHIEKTGKAAIRPTLAPAACLHCKDPECLTGCPTGAIGRYSSGQIDINAGTCIGCGDCATNCPYNAISMASRKPAPPPVDVDFKGKLRRWLSLKADPLPPPVEQSDELLAVKCNLCSGTSLNPSDDRADDRAGSKTPAYGCEENCPTGALARVNPGKYFAEIEQIGGLAFLDKTHAIGRNIHKSDPLKRLMHLAGVSLVLFLNAGAIALLNRYGFREPVLGPFNMRWVTGLAGLIGIAAVMAYAVRRQIFKRRAGPLRYWMLAHSYLGMMGGVMLLLHGGASSGGALTTALMISFDLVILTGLFGIFCYLAIPRLLTRLEGDPLLLDDLLKRQRELRDEIVKISSSAKEPLRRMITERVAARFFSLGYLLRQFLKREDLNSMLESARAEFEPIAGKLIEKQDRERLLKTVETAATLRRVDALILLHKLLKAWLPPHVMATALMLALLFVHIVQVIYAWR
ncbi:MAG: cyclic nucleotide-binding domain-containing protein [Blastocatellales bacterium]